MTSLDINGPVLTTENALTVLRANPWRLVNQGLFTQQYVSSTRTSWAETELPPTWLLLLHLIGSSTDPNQPSWAGSSGGCTSHRWTCQDWPCLALHVGGSALASIPRHIFLRIFYLVWRCLLGKAPGYLRELCHPVSFYGGRRSLRSSTQGDPFARAATMQERTFSVVGPVELFSVGRCASSLWVFRRRSMGSLRLIISTWPGSGAPLSRDLEVATYIFCLRDLLVEFLNQFHNN